MLGRVIRHPVFWIFLLAFFLRVVKLGVFPFGFHSDEMRAGWNAYSILTTGHDDKGNFLPLYYNSFGDFRPTGIFYTIIPSLILFGKTEFAVRFPSALIGALTVFPLFLFVEKLTKKRKLAVFSAFFLALSPWHMEVSRATSEIIIASFLTLYSLYFLLRLNETNKRKYLIYTLALALASYFFYHSTRIVTPIFFALTAFHLKTNKKLVVFAVLASFVLTLLFSLNPDSRGRLNQVSVMGDFDVKYELENARDFVNNKYVIYTKRVVNEYAKYFSADFLIGYSARPYRYITPGIGILTYIEGVLLILGLIQIAKGKMNVLPFLLLLASPIPAALTTEDSPNLMRSFYMILFIAVMCSYGFMTLGRYKKTAMIFLVLNFLFFSFLYFRHSYIHRPLIANPDMDSSSYRNIGTKELVFKLNNIKDSYEKIIVTGFPDNIKPWYEFFIGKVPENIIFSDLKCPSDDSFVEENPDNILVVDSWQCSPESKIKDGLKIKITEKIQRPDKFDAFLFITRSDDYFLQKKAISQ